MDFEMTEKDIQELKNRSPVYDEDCPPLTKEKADKLIYLMKKYKTRRITKEILTLEQNAKIPA